MAFDEPPRPDERLDDWARAVVDAALEVHKVLGPGFAESVHEEALAVELSRRDIPFERQVPLTVKYKGFCVGEGRVDLLVGGELIVELKSVEQLAGVHVAQVISYLKAFERPPEVALTASFSRVAFGASSSPADRKFLGAPWRSRRLGGKRTLALGKRLLL